MLISRGNVEKEGSPPVRSFNPDGGRLFLTPADASQGARRVVDSPGLAGERHVMSLPIFFCKCNSRFPARQQEVACER